MVQVHGVEYMAGLVRAMCSRVLPDSEFDMRLALPKAGGALSKGRRS